MNDHIKAVLNQMSPEERAFFEKDPAQGWLAQMQDKYSTMTVPDAVAALKAEMPQLKSLPPPPAAAAQSPREPHDPAPTAPLRNR